MRPEISCVAFSIDVPSRRRACDREFGALTHGYLAHGAGELRRREAAVPAAGDPAAPLR
jgi:hypothetical protein